MRARKKKNLMPRLGKCAEYIIEKPEIMNGETRPVYLEIGCGKGKFAAETAQKSDCLFFAMEIMRDIAVMAVEKGAALELHNLRYILSGAENVLELFPPESVDIIYLNFSDPWPKKRAAKRRLTHKNFLGLYKKILKKDGIIAFKTDNRPLFDFSVKEFKENGFDIFDYTENLHESGIENTAMTEYEQRFTALGQPIYHVKAKLNAN